MAQNLDEFRDANGIVNTVIGKMRYIEFGRKHHICISNKTFGVVVSQIDSMLEFGYVMGVDSDGDTGFIPYEAHRNGLPQLQLKFLLSRFTEARHPIASVRFVTARVMFEIGGYSSTWSSKNHHKCCNCKKTFGIDANNV